MEGKQQMTGYTELTNNHKRLALKKQSERTIQSQSTQVTLNSRRNNSMSLFKLTFLQLI